MSAPLRPEQFDTLLHRLGPDRELAGLRYEQLRRRLVSLFGYRGCAHSEELADETLDRAARRLEEMGNEFVGSDPERFVYGIAWNVARESFRRRSTVPLPEGWEGRAPVEPPGAEDEERERACLDRCLDRLALSERRVVLGYFEGERGARIRRRSELSRELGVSQNALRLKIHRLTGRLRECVVRCADQGGGGAGAALRGARETRG
jgi:DNA-directed RNA polymerase specialized sigma24 family protein